MLGWATDQAGVVWLARIRFRHCLACHASVFVVVWPATHLSSSLSGLPRMAWHYRRWRLRRSASVGGLLVEPSHARLGHRPTWHCLAATHSSSSLTGLPRIYLRHCLACHAWRGTTGDGGFGGRLRRSASAGGLLVEPSHARLGHRPTWRCLAGTHSFSSLSGLPRMAWHYRRWRLRRSASAGGLLVEPSHARLGHRPSWHCLAATHLSSSLSGLPRMAWHYRRWRLRRSASVGGLVSMQAMPATANPDRAATSVDPGHAWIGHRPTPPAQRRP